MVSINIFRKKKKTIIPTKQEKISNSDELS